MTSHLFGRDIKYFVTAFQSLKVCETCEEWNHIINDQW